jgi:hypothetical protein
LVSRWAGWLKWMGCFRDINDINDIISVRVRPTWNLTGCF